MKTNIKKEKMASTLVREKYAMIILGQKVEGCDIYLLLSNTLARGGLTALDRFDLSVVFILP